MCPQKAIHPTILPISIKIQNHVTPLISMEEENFHKLTLENKRKHLRELEKLYTEKLGMGRYSIRMIRKEIKYCKECREILDRFLETSDYGGYLKFIRNQYSGIISEEIPLKIL